jgi:hypothetical protein
MKRFVLLALMLPMMLAAAPRTDDRIAVNSKLAEIYRPYTIEAVQPAVWDRPLFTLPVRRLIARWKQVMSEDEIDDLNGGDWFCLCQDWDPKAFRALPRGHRQLPGGVLEVTMAIDLGYGQSREARFRFKREGPDWRIDNLFARDFPRGLQQALRETIALDEKLPR